LQSKTLDKRGIAAHGTILDSQKVLAADAAKSCYPFWERGKMADLSSVSEAAKSIGDLIAGFVPEGPLRQAVLVVEGLCGLAAPVTYKYYWRFGAGGKPERSLERQDYGRYTDVWIMRVP
jgi:hypothetical protein